MAGASAEGRKQEQILVRVTEDQSDVVATLVHVLVGSNPSEVLRRLIDEERARRELASPDFTEALAIRQRSRAAERRSKLAAVKDEAEGYGA
jgi:hypothetical protein